MLESYKKKHTFSYYLYINACDWPQSQAFQIHSQKGVNLENKDFILLLELILSFILLLLDNPKGRLKITSQIHKFFYTSNGTFIIKQNNLILPLHYSINRYFKIGVIY